LWAQTSPPYNQNLSYIKSAMSNPYGDNTPQGAPHGTNFPERFTHTSQWMQGQNLQPTPNVNIRVTQPLSQSAPQPPVSQNHASFEQDFERQRQDFEARYQEALRRVTSASVANTHDHSNDRTDKNVQPGRPALRQSVDQDLDENSTRHFVSAQADPLEVNSIHTYDSDAQNNQQLPHFGGTTSPQVHKAQEVVDLDEIVARQLQPRARPLYVSHSPRPHVEFMQKSMDWREREANAIQEMPDYAPSKPQGPIGWKGTIKTGEHRMKIKRRDHRARNEIGARSPSPTKHGRIFAKMVEKPDSVPFRNVFSFHSISMHSNCFRIRYFRFANSPKKDSEYNDSGSQSV
jgi:hypothetical protein